MKMYMEMDAKASPQDPRFTFDWTSAESVASAVIRAVAIASDADPAEMETLYSAVDADSLNALFEPYKDHTAEAKVVVEFVYNGMVVEVSSTGEGRVFAHR